MNNTVLHIVGALNMGGVETMLMNIYRNLDFKKVKFDFIVNGPEIGYYEKEIDTKSSRIHHIHKRSDSWLKHMKDIYKIIKKEKYSIVHYHTENAFLAFMDLIVCKLAGAKNLIVHSHNTMDYRGGKIAQLSRLFQKPLYYLVQNRLSCGDAASKWLYGTTENVNVISLPVDCKKYRFSFKEQVFLKKKFGLEEFKIYTHVGSFSKVKNQLFLLEIFKEIYKVDNKSILFLIGGGEYEKEIKKKILRLDLKENVFMLGTINDVYNKLIMSDIFILPSLFEGFPTVLLEAQAAGLPCFVSNTVTDKIALTDSVYFYSLEKRPKEWADFILSKRNNSIYDREKANDIIADNYDIKKVVNEFYNIYKIN